jgi:hypothetical protein
LSSMLASLPAWILNQKVALLGIPILSKSNML